MSVMDLAPVAPTVELAPVGDLHDAPLVHPTDYSSLKAFPLLQVGPGD